jgi:hypothetical protein
LREAAAGVSLVGAALGKLENPRRISVTGSSRARRGRARLSRRNICHNISSTVATHV